LDGVLEHAKLLGVLRFLSISVDLNEYESLVQIVEKYPQVWMSVGVHPCDVCDLPTVEQLIKLCEHPKAVAIGETGLDYYKASDALLQQESFRVHIRAAVKIGLPLIVHTREAREDTIRLLREEGAEQCKGVLHCFTESLEMAQQAIELGFYISLSGIITFKNAVGLKEVAKVLPLERLLVETDSPYLAPMPHRGKKNYPGYTRLVAEHLAELRGISFEEVAQKTTENFNVLFHKTQPHSEKTRA
jgi:TatD DNase family protein